MMELYQQRSKSAISSGANDKFLPLKLPNKCDPVTCSASRDSAAHDLVIGMQSARFQLVQRSDVICLVEPVVIVLVIYFARSLHIF